MNEEEIIQAIENDLKTIDLYKNTYDIKYSKLLDLYNKQKERIEELEEIEQEHRKQNGELQEKIKELENADLTAVWIDGVADGKKYYRNKIKEKIEELKGFINDCIISEKGSFCESCKDRCFFNEEIEDLQELLEEQEDK